MTTLGTTPKKLLLQGHGHRVTDIDIIEHVRFDLDQLHRTVHTKAYNHMLCTQKGATRWVGDTTSGCRDYAGYLRGDLPKRSTRAAREASSSSTADR